MHEVGILGDSHSINDAAGAVVRLTTVVGVGIAEDNLHAARRHTTTRTRTLTPVVVPAAHHLDGQLIHVVVILQGRVPAIERTVALFVVRVALLVPVFSQSLVATIFHRPHRVLLRLIDVEHLAAILRLVNIEHLTTADGSASMRVVRIADGLHLQHVLTRDALVAALVKEYRGIVAVIDDGVAHHRLSLFPPWAVHVLLGIASGHRLWQSHTVARLHVLLPRCHVHPAHHVGT